MQLLLPMFFITAGVFALASSTFSLHPYNEYDSYYDALVRKHLGTFHINLSHGLYSSNGPMVSPSIQWNVNGQFLISRTSFVTHLTGFNTTFHGLQVPDVYHVVDGHAGAVMYHLQGRQSGPFEGINPSGKSINIMGGEFMSFDSDALLSSLKTVEEFAVAERQLRGQTQPAPPAANLTSLLVPNEQTSPQFRQRSRQILASIHDNFNAGNNAANAALTEPNVVVVRGSVGSSTGPQAFVDLIGTWKKAFPDMVFHDDTVLADGTQGAVEWVWEGTQTGPYTALNGTVLPPSRTSVRLRGFLFFEFEESGLMKKVVGIWDDGVIEEQLSGGPAYP